MQVEDFERELDSRLAKKLKYKNLYKQEREKVEGMRRQSEVELKKKDEEIDRLKKQIKDLPNNWDLKVRALEVGTGIMVTYVRKMCYTDSNL